MADPFFVLLTVSIVAAFATVCGCICMCCYFARRRGRFPFVNRNGPDQNRFNRSGPAFGANRSAFGANRSTFGAGLNYNESANIERFDNYPAFGFSYPTDQTEPPFESDALNPNNTIVNTYGWNTTAPDRPPFESDGLNSKNDTIDNSYSWDTHTADAVVNELPSYSDATRNRDESRHQSSNQNEFCYSEFSSHNVKAEDDSGKCDSGGKYSSIADDSGGGTTTNGDDRDGGCDISGGTYDSGGGGDSGGGTCDSGGGDSGGGDSGGGGGDSGGGDTSGD